MSADGRKGPLAPGPQPGGQHRPGVRPERTRIVELCAAPPEGSTVICAGEPGPAVPRTFPPAPGWAPGGHRVKAPPGYSRGPEKTRACGGLRVRDGQALTLCAPSRNSRHCQDFLRLEEQACPEGTICVITGNLSSRDSNSTRAWLQGHPCIRHAFTPKKARWLNLQEAWWRIFRRQALAGQDFADPDEITCATRVATARLNARARPGPGAGPSPGAATTAGALCTSFKERCTNGSLLTLDVAGYAREWWCAAHPGGA